MGEDEPARDLLLRATHLDEKRWRSFEALGVLADRRKEPFVALGNYDARASPSAPRGQCAEQSRLLAGSSTAI